MTRIFGKIEMTWKKVIWFAIIVGVYAGLINQVPFLIDTSFQDINICLEWWILFAVIIAVNCEKPLEAGMKIFIFFLISQPLIFLVEMPTKGIGVWRYYRYWFIITLLTLPGGFLANFVRRKNLIGMLSLSLALILLSSEVVTHLSEAYLNFPHHLLSALVSLVIMIVFMVKLLDKKSFRVLAATIGAIALIVNSTILLTRKDTIAEPLPEISGTWDYTLANTKNCSAEIGVGEFIYSYNTFLSASNEITLTNENGTSITYVISRPKGKKLATITKK